MERKIGRLLGLAAAALLWIGSANAASGRFVTLTDLHFNPFYDPSLVAQLKAQPVGQWGALLADSSPAGFGDYGGMDETNDALLRSVLADAARREANPDFVLFTGDIIAHEFQSRFGVSSPTPEYEAFVLKSVRYVLGLIRDTFPGKPVYFTLGNNDSYCGDYKVAPEGAFLADTAALIADELLKDPPAAADYRRGGYYSVAVPGLERSRMVAVNTILFSRNYEDPCGPKLSYDPAEAQLRWLDTTLAAAKARGERVWLLLHVPPGVDVYSTLKGVEGGKVNEVTPMWQPERLASFLELVARYPRTIRAAYAGHTHMDNFRLVEDAKGRAEAYVHIGPAVSPQFGNNPAYGVYRYDPTAFELRDFTTFYLNIAEQGVGGWQPEYDFARGYGIPAVSPASLDALHGSLATDSDRRGLWERVYNVSHTASPAIDADNWKGYWCGINGLTNAAFTECFNTP